MPSVSCAYLERCAPSWDLWLHVLWQPGQDGPDELVPATIIVCNSSERRGAGAVGSGIMNSRSVEMYESIEMVGLHKVIRYLTLCAASCLHSGLIASHAGYAWNATSESSDASSHMSTP